MSDQLQKVSLLLEVSEPEKQDDNGTYKTYLTHPKLGGSLEFIHGEFAGREELLRAIDQNLVSGVLNAVTMIGGLVNEFKKTAGSGRAPVNFPKGKS